MPVRRLARRPRRQGRVRAFAAKDEDDGERGADRPRAHGALVERPDSGE